MEEHIGEQYTEDEYNFLIDALTFWEAYNNESRTSGITDFGSMVNTFFVAGQNMQAEIARKEEDETRKRRRKAEAACLLKAKLIRSKENLRIQPLKDIAGNMGDNKESKNG